MKPTDMHQHIVALCGNGDFAVYWCKRIEQARALREIGEVHVPKIKSEISYAVALHEIGHLQGRHQNSSRVMVRERWAWAWARKHAMVWTARMEMQVRASLKWYAPRARRIDARRAKWSRPVHLTI